MPTIVFEASIVGPAMTVEEPDGGRLVDICDDARAPVPFSCRGASCGMCRVDVLEGADQLSPPDRYERNVLASFGDPPTRRLACAASVAPGIFRLRLRAVEDSGFYPGY